MDRAASDEEQLWHQRQEFITTCMKAAGFDHLARPFADEVGAMSGGFAPAIDAETGYGIAERIPDMRARLLGENENPNRAIVDTMSASERAGWALAYGGADTVMDWSGFVLLDESTGNPLMTDQAPVRGGCVGLALAEFGSGEVLEPFADELGQVVADLLSDPELTRIDTAWSRCVAESGLRHPSPRAAVELLQAEALGLAFGDLPIDEFATRERDVAAIDQRCRVVSDYDRVASALDDRFAIEAMRLIDGSS